MTNELIARLMSAVPYMGTARISNPQTQLELVLHDYTPKFSFWYDYDTSTLSLHLADKLTGTSIHEPVLTYNVRNLVSGKHGVIDFEEELLSLVEKAILKLMKRFMDSQSKTGDE